MQLESGKVIAIRASMKAGQPNASGDLKNSGIPGILESSDAGELQNRKPIVNSDDVIDMTNSDDDDETNIKSLKDNHDISFKENHSVPKEVENDGNQENNEEEIIFKEKPVYKPNLVQRKPKILHPPTTDVTTSITSVITTPSTQSNQSNFDSQSSSYDSNNYNRWNRLNDKSSTNYVNQPFQDEEGNSRSSDQQMPFELRKLDIFLINFKFYNINLFSIYYSSQCCNN